MRNDKGEMRNEKKKKRSQLGRVTTHEILSTK